MFNIESGSNAAVITNVDENTLLPNGKTKNEKKLNTVCNLGFILRKYKI